MRGKKKRRPAPAGTDRRPTPTAKHNMSKTCALLLLFIHQTFAGNIPYNPDETTGGLDWQDDVKLNSGDRCGQAVSLTDEQACRNNCKSGGSGYTACGGTPADRPSVYAWCTEGAGQASGGCVSANDCFCGRNGRDQPTLQVREQVGTHWKVSDIYSSAGGASQDLHIQYPAGGRTDFRGTPGTYYNLISAPGVSVNAVVSASDFHLRGALIHGTFMTQAHVVYRTREGFFNLSFWADKVGPNHYSYSMINGTCGGTYVALGPKGRRACGAVVASVDYSTLHVVGTGSKLSISARPVYDRVAGPLHRLDMKAAMTRRPEKMHGLLGQGFFGAPRHGKVDVYPSSGEYTTVAWGEGAIDGAPRDYEVSHRWGTGFAYSCFNAAYLAETAAVSGAVTSDDSTGS